MSSEEASPLIHETAIVEPGAVLGRGVRVWHHVHIREGAVIGDGTVLGKNVFVDAGVQLGRGVHIQNNVSIYRGVHIEDDVLIGPSAVFTNDRYPRTGSNDWVPEDTWVRQGASVGANATIITGNTIGAWAMIGAGAVVTRSVLPQELVAGNPAKRLGWVCRCGNVLVRTSESVSDVTCSRCGLEFSSE